MLWDLNIKNTGTATRNLQVFSFCECLFHAVNSDNQNFQMSMYCSGADYRDGVIEQRMFYEPGSRCKRPLLRFCGGGKSKRRYPDPGEILRFSDGRSSLQRVKGILGGGIKSPSDSNSQPGDERDD